MSDQQFNPYDNGEMGVNLSKGAGANPIPDQTPGQTSDMTSDKVSLDKVSSENAYEDDPVTVVISPDYLAQNQKIAEYLSSQNNVQNGFEQEEIKSAVPVSDNDTGFTNIGAASSMDKQAFGGSDPFVPEEAATTVLSPDYLEKNAAAMEYLSSQPNMQNSFGSEEVREAEAVSDIQSSNGTLDPVMVYDGDKQMSTDAYFDPSSQPAMNPYGGQQANPYGGQQANPYGGQQANPYGGQQASPYGGQQASPYGAQAQNPYSGVHRQPGQPIDSYTNQKADPYAAQAQSSPYGASNQSTPYGQSNPNNGYGQGNQSSPYNQNGQSSIYGQSTYGQSSVNQMELEPEDGKATASMVLSILSLIFCCLGVILAPIGMVLGKSAMNAGNTGYKARTGWIVGIIGLVINILTIIIVIAIFVSTQ